VLRFAPLFDGHDQAARFATRQALAWIGPPAVPATAYPTTTPE
jgi:hypothetical protein